MTNLEKEEENVSRSDERERLWLQRRRKSAKGLRKDNRRTRTRRRSWRHDQAVCKTGLRRRRIHR
jgi:hypothetical protein